jgi:hypothetical protein
VKIRYPYKILIILARTAHKIEADSRWLIFFLIPKLSWGIR